MNENKHTPVAHLAADSALVRNLPLDMRQSGTQSGYTSCACRDCMDVTVSSDMSKPELCSECKDAGCEAYPAALATVDHVVTPASIFECQRADAYEEC